MKKTMISIIIPVYNRHEELRDCLRSCVEQNTPYDYEIIVIDDGSSNGDQIKEVIEGFSDCRVRLYTKSNGGACSARNLGVTYSDSEYVLFLDSDDTLLDNAISELVANQMPYSSRDDIVVYSPLIVDLGGGRQYVKPSRAVYPGEPISEYLFSSGNWVPASCILISKSLALKVNWREGLGFGDDADFAIRLEAAGATFIMADKPLARYDNVPRPGRLSNSINKEEFEDWICEIKHLMTGRAYLALRGSHRAKVSSFFTKTVYFLNAVLVGSFSAKHAIRVFLQLFIPEPTYRHIVNIFADLQSRS